MLALIPKSHEMALTLRMNKSNLGIAMFEMKKKGVKLLLVSHINNLIDNGCFCMLGVIACFFCCPHIF